MRKNLNGSAKKGAFEFGTKSGKPGELPAVRPLIGAFYELADAKPQGSLDETFAAGADGASSNAIATKGAEMRNLNKPEVELIAVGNPGETYRDERKRTGTAKIP